jgi:hypothetical protein
VCASIRASSSLPKKSRAGFLDDITVDVEAKAKELAVSRLQKQVTRVGRATSNRRVGAERTVH